MRNYGFESSEIVIAQSFFLAYKLLFLRIMIFFEMSKFITFSAVSCGPKINLGKEDLLKVIGQTRYFFLIILTSIRRSPQVGHFLLVATSRSASAVLS